MDFGFVAVPSISVICYLVGMIVKASPLDSRFIPSICGVLGGFLGAAAMFLIPSVIGSDPFMAVAIGIVSGFAATGVHQVAEQLKNDVTDEKVDLS